MEEEFRTRYGQLNAAQRQAVDTIEGPVLVVAGPGSGKTELLAVRIANILRLADVYPGNILCLTFTEAAATNMRNRLRGLIGETAYKVAVHTFHSFGTETISRYPEYFFQGATFSPANDLAQIEIIEAILQDLPHGAPLRSEHPEEGFVYLRDLRSAISQIKRAGLDPQEFSGLIDANALSMQPLNKRLHELFDGRLSGNSLPRIAEFTAGLKDDTYEAALARSLAGPLREAGELGKAAPLSEWKSRHLAKAPDGQRVLKDSLHAERMRSLAKLYGRYQEALYSRRLFDFDDMLLRVIHVTQGQPALLADLQERYQYLLVDEFQDTNDAQMRLLRLLTDNPVHEGRPNVLAVGDDDQSIYKFQGAEVANILGFGGQFADPEIITLTENYRSGQPIIDVAQRVIRQGSERLENLVPGLDKTLRAADPERPAAVSYRQAASPEAQYSWISQEIAVKRQAGEPLSGIAVIARHHKELQALLPFFQQQGIPVRYERQQNVLDQPHIRQLVTMARFVCSLGRHQEQEADWLLPELLSYPCWEVPRTALWKLGVDAYSERRTWLDLMQKDQDPRLRGISDFLIELGVRSQSEPLEELLKELIGADPLSVPDSEEEEPPDNASAAMRSPFKRYYFSPECLRADPMQYLAFLSGLKTFVTRLREYRPDEQLRLSDLLDFVDAHDRNGVAILDTGDISLAADAVSLLTAHKAKGLEFTGVFVLSCQQEVWAGRGRSSLIRFPLNLPLSPSGDSADDQLRLFYVALTRAKSNLCLVSYSQSEGKESLPVEFLSGATWRPTGDIPRILVLEQEIAGWTAKPRPLEEQALLRRELERYTLNVTHLNNFLDVAHAGPQAFLEQNLLRFPQPKSSSDAFGSAIHATLNQVAVQAAANGALPQTEAVLEWFDRHLYMQRLSEREYRLLLGRGRSALQAFYASRSQEFLIHGESERDFHTQHIRLGGVPVTGKIDRITIEGSGLVLTDFKTGRPARDWRGRTLDEKIKLRNYRRQLAFYSLLVQGSRDYAGRTVAMGRLEFVEPERDTESLWRLEAELSQEETDRVLRLARAVYDRIMALDFPDVSRYSKDLDGIERFEDELLTATI